MRAKERSNNLESDDPSLLPCIIPQKQLTRSSPQSREGGYIRARVPEESFHMPLTTQLRGWVCFGEKKILVSL